MAVAKYKTKKGNRYLVEVYQDGQRVAVKAGFEKKLEALQWEKNYLESKYIPKPKDLALFEVVTLYLLEAEPRKKKNTLSYKKSVLGRFSEYIGENTSFLDITRQEINGFLTQAAKDISPKSANKYKIEISALWSWAQIEGYAVSNPARQIKPFPVKRNIRYIPPKEHIAKALDCANKFERDFMLMLLHTAGRISEIRELTWDDVDIDRGFLRLWTSKRSGGDRESRTIAISPTLHEILSRLNSERTGGEIYVFTNPRTATGYSRQSIAIKRMFQSVCNKAEIPLFTAHSLRHFVATHFDNPRRAQRILGHMNIKTTEIYLHELDVDMGAADIFESITNEITNRNIIDQEKGSTFIQ